MEDKCFYDSSSIAARSKREQLLKEAEEYRLRRHIATLKKLEPSEKAHRFEDQRKGAVPPEIHPRPVPGH